MTDLASLEYRESRNLGHSCVGRKLKHWREHEGYTADLPATLDDLRRPTDGTAWLVKPWLSTIKVSRGKHTDGENNGTLCHMCLLRARIQRGGDYRSAKQYARLHRKGIISNPGGRPRLQPRQGGWEGGSGGRFLTE